MPLHKVRTKSQEVGTAELGQAFPRDIKLALPHTPLHTVTPFHCAHHISAHYPIGIL